MKGWCSDELSPMELETFREAFMNRTYNWLHITTGERGTSIYVGESIHTLLEFLNHCNSQNAGTWMYWY
jgi:hypothetical protein